MEVVKLNDSAFHEAIKEHKKVIVKFYAGWCGSCRLIAPKFSRLANDEQNNEGYFVEIDAESNPESRKLAGVNNLPFFAGFKDGQLVEGFPSAKIEAVQELINKL